MRGVYQKDVALHPRCQGTKSKDFTTLVHMLGKTAKKYAQLTKTVHHLITASHKKQMILSSSIVT